MTQLQKAISERQLRREEYQSLKSQVEQVVKEIARLELELRAALAELPAASSPGSRFRIPVTGRRQSFRHPKTSRPSRSRPRAWTRRLANTRNSPT